MCARKHACAHACAAPHGLARNRTTALIWAADKRHKEIVELLLKAPSIDINAQDDEDGYVDVGRQGCRADMRTCGRTCMDRGHVCD